MTEAGYAGGAPILGEGLALDLMNTFYATRGRPAEGLASVSDATGWVRQLAHRLTAAGAAADGAQVLEDELDALLRLREAARGIADALVDEGTPGKDDINVVNRVAALAPQWTSLHWKSDGGGAKDRHATGRPVNQVLGVLASDAIDLFTGSDAARLRRCERPGCPLFFLKDHPRREWCTPACGARVRAARSYRKRSQRVRTSA